MYSGRDHRTQTGHPIEGRFSRCSASHRRRYAFITKIDSIADISARAEVTADLIVIANVLNAMLPMESMRNRFVLKEISVWSIFYPTMERLLLIQWI